MFKGPGPFAVNDERLKAVFELIGSCASVADVGCDHGYLSAALILNGRAERVIASDISPVSAAKAGALAERLGISDRMTARAADGLDAAAELSPPFSIAICGMGGELIAGILERGKATASKAEHIVMQPMRGEAELRRYLYGNGFRITDERVVLDNGRYYQAICAVPNEEDAIPEGFPKDFFRFGWVMAQKRDPNLLPLLKHYRLVYRRELERARLKGRSPEPILREIENTEALMRFIGFIEE